MPGKIPVLFGASIKTALQDSMVWLCTAVIVALLFAAILALCLTALYFYLAGIFVLPIAALLTAAGALVLVGFIGIGAWITTRMVASKAQAHDDSPAAGASSPLESVLAGQLGQWIKSNAKTATVASLLAGVAAGASPELRRLLSDILGRAGSSK